MCQQYSGPVIWNLLLKPTGSADLLESTLGYLVPMLFDMVLAEAAEKHAGKILNIGTKLQRYWAQTLLVMVETCYVRLCLYT